MTTISQYLEQLASEIDISTSKYEEPEKRYKAVGDWFSRPESRFSGTTVDVYTQGSFRLGTVVKPISGADDYDIDLVCSVGYPKTWYTQKELKGMFGEELDLYVQAQNMQNPKEEI